MTIYCHPWGLDSRFRGNDKKECGMTEGEGGNDTLTFIVIPAVEPGSRKNKTIIDVIPGLTGNPEKC